MSTPASPTNYTFKMQHDEVDVYDILRAIPQKDPAIQHALKKLINPGRRGNKSFAVDCFEAVWSITDAVWNNIDGDPSIQRTYVKQMENMISKLKAEL